MVEKDLLRKKYEGGRSTLLAIAAFSAINFVLLIANADMYFLFSASVPQLLVILGMYLTGSLPSEWYDPSMQYTFLDESFLTIAIILAVVIIAMYFVAWLLSKNKKGWLLFGLIFFIVDTIAGILYYGLEITYLMDLVFHIVAIVTLVIGLNAGNKLAKIEEREAVSAMHESDEDVFDLNNVNQDGTVIPSNNGNSPILRVANMDEKFKVLLQAQVLDHEVVYRRVKRTNELVIDGNVYAEYTALLEFDHTLTAVIDGHEIAAGLVGNKSVIFLDGIVVVSKTRLI